MQINKTKEKFKFMKLMNKVKEEWSEIRELISKVNPLVMTFFVLSVVAMNLLANKSIDLSMLPGNNTAAGEIGWLALDCGILVSWLAFFAMDNIVRRFGPKASTQMTIVAVFINLVVCCVFLLAGNINGYWGESYVDVGGELINNALNNTISGTWYVLMGSTIAFISSAIIHGISSCIIAKRFKETDQDSLKVYAACSFVATSLGQFADNMIFALIVSHNFFGWNLLQCVMCSVTGMVVEFILSAIFVPFGHKIYKNDQSKV